VLNSTSRSSSVSYTMRDPVCTEDVASIYIAPRTFLTQGKPYPQISVPRNFHASVRNFRDQKATRYLDGFLFYTACPFYFRFGGNVLLRKISVLPSTPPPCPFAFSPSEGLPLVHYLFPPYVCVYDRSLPIYSACGLRESPHHLTIQSTGEASVLLS
jgi:hypothetical protein